MIFVSLGIVEFLLQYVVPKMISVYSNIGQALPGMTQVLLGISAAIKSFGVYFVLEAMGISSALITNIPIRKAVEEATNHVREGANINLALKQTTYFPPMSIHLIASGEASGQLENMLERAASNQDNEISRLIETSLALFEPAIILIMGTVILFIVLAVLLPIFQLDQFAGYIIIFFAA